MILADKIITLRKKAGWSQEELAGQLGVSRQSVSKWEGAQSVPDMDKVLQMSRLFSVTTDYLLKDEMEEPELQEETTDSFLRRVTMEEASGYLSLSRKNAPTQALATFLCVISPIALLLLAGLSELPTMPLSENAAGGIGLCVLILLVAIGVMLFMSCSARVKEYEFLEKESFETEYGVTGMVREKKKNFKETNTRLNIAGTLLCICSVLPLFATLCFTEDDFLMIVAVCLLLLFVAIGSAVFVYNGTLQGAMEKLLEEGDYTRAEKSRSGIRRIISGCYWLIVTAIFLIPVLGFGDPGQYVLIWPVAGVLYGAVMIAIRLFDKSK